MTAMIAPKTRNLIVKLLGKTDTPFEGESVAFIQKANQIRREQKLTWDDLIIGREDDCNWAPPPPPEPPPSNHLADMLFAKRHISQCSPWEQNFLSSVSALSSLSQKQRAVLVRIVTKLRARGLL